MVEEQNGRIGVTRMHKEFAWEREEIKEEDKC
jgi:hypothetical protein